MPADIARKAERLGVAKAGMDPVRLFALAVLAGAFIGLGAMAASIAWTGTAGALPFGVARVLGGLVFSLGLILVVVGGAELFTGNNLMVMALAGRRITALALLRAWAIVFAGNLVGAVGTALLVFLGGDHFLADGAVGMTALAIGEAKSALPFGRAFFLGVLCNVLVCLAVWMCYGARTTTDKILAILFPVAAFVAAGFEHSVANMYFMPKALMILWWAPAEFWSAAGATAADFPALGIRGVVANLVPVTLGNVVGGGVFVGLVYWFIYLRRDPG
ncbi:MAG: formate/nitrite transporter family protein [Alphaproteobacteria bacterium]|nr:formate/nitrite transporter family protein [Alphaproteobacteria bacterium]